MAYTQNDPGRVPEPTLSIAEVLYIKKDLASVHALA
jgi:hypothetical protein